MTLREHHHPFRPPAFPLLRPRTPAPFFIHRPGSYMGLFLGGLSRAREAHPVIP